MFTNFLDLDIEDFLSELEPDEQPLWGQMTAQHMVEHLTETLQYSNGIKALKSPNVPSHTFDALKRFLMSDKEFPQGFISPLLGETLADLRNLDLFSALEELKTNNALFKTYFKENPDAVFFNPTFGVLNFKEWQQFHGKHFFHHLKQFGLV